MRAASSGFPFGVPATSRAHASVVIETTHSATASRSVICLPPTSTMRATGSGSAASEGCAIASVLHRTEQHDLDGAARDRGPGAGRDGGEPVGLGHGGDQIRAAATGGGGHPSLLR